jgi:hypothetical protein
MLLALGEHASSAGGVAGARKIPQASPVQKIRRTQWRIHNAFAGYS